jgi:hypothetical protein
MKRGIVKAAGEKVAEIRDGLEDERFADRD